MIDVESLGTDPGSLIVSFAIVPFNLQTMFTYQPAFLANISMESSYRKGMKTKADKLRTWIMNKDGRSEQRKELFVNDRDVTDVMVDAAAYISMFGADVYVWSKDMLDLILMKDYFRACRIKTPWRYYRERCVRTVADFDPELRKEAENEVSNIQYSPFNDCMVQIEYVRRIINQKGPNGYHFAAMQVKPPRTPES